jgi:NAD(P)-dependent dehydrogenase (short-subunit alcohol dehydrogenase family)
MSGRTVVITGASSGVGAAAAAELARCGAHVVLAVRNVAAGRAVADAIGGDVEVRFLDLVSLDSVRAFVDGWSGDIDVLVNNAGVMFAPPGRTLDGFELHIGTNHLGPFALTTLLLPHLTGRVVTLTSKLAARGQVDLDDLNWERRPYNPTQAYADSKQANLLFTLELQRRLAATGRGVIAVAAHPGIASTNLFSHTSGPAASVSRLLVRLVAQSSEQGALPTLYAATADIPGNALVGPAGIAHLRGHPTLQAAPGASQDPTVAAALWELSARLTGTAGAAAFSS